MFYRVNNAGFFHLKTTTFAQITEVLWFQTCKHVEPKIIFFWVAEGLSVVTTHTHTHTHTSVRTHTNIQTYYKDRTREEFCFLDSHNDDEDDDDDKEEWVACLPFPCSPLLLSSSFLQQVGKTLLFSFSLQESAIQEDHDDTNSSWLLIWQCLWCVD